MPKIKGKTGKGHYWQLDPHAKNQFNDSTVRRRPRGYRAIIQASKLTSSACPPASGSVGGQSSHFSSLDFNSTGFNSTGFSSTDYNSSDSPAINYSTGHFGQASNSFYGHPATACSATPPNSADYMDCRPAPTLNQPAAANRQQLAFHASLSPPLDQSNQVTSSTFDSAAEQRTVASSHSFYPTTSTQITRKSFELNSILLQPQHQHHQQQHHQQQHHQQQHPLPEQVNLSSNSTIYSSNLTTGTSPCFHAATAEFTAEFTPSVYPNLFSTRLVPVDANYAKTGSSDTKPNQAKQANPRFGYAELGYYSPDNKPIYSNVAAQKAYLEEQTHSIASYEPASECRIHFCHSV